MGFPDSDRGAMNAARMRTPHIQDSGSIDDLEIMDNCTLDGLWAAGVNCCFKS